MVILLMVMDVIQLVKLKMVLHVLQPMEQEEIVQLFVAIPFLL